VLHGAAVLALAPAGLRAQAAWPARPVAVTVGLQSGTGSDVAVRNVMQKVAASIGQPMVISNLLGAAGQVAAQHGAKQPPDGYGLVALSNAVVTTLPHMQRSSFDPIRELVPIAGIVSFPSVISVNAKVPAATIQEFIELARRNPGRFSYASGGVGSVQHTAMEQLKAMAGIDLLHVPYKGNASLGAEVLAGTIDLAFEPLVTLVPLIRSGKLRALAVSTPRRAPGLDDIPTVAEQGLPGYQHLAWLCAFARAGTPPEIVTQLNAWLVQILRTQEAADFFRQNAVWEPMIMTPEQGQRFVASEVELWRKAVQRAGIEPQ
jgi:tripartite-type tricarboxylate transporter receptor subunit TctC